MKSITVALGALLLFACGGSDNKTAQNPNDVQTTSANPVNSSMDPQSSTTNTHAMTTPNTSPGDLNGTNAMDPNAPSTAPTKDYRTMATQNANTGDHALAPTSTYNGGTAGSNTTTPTPAANTTGTWGANNTNVGRSDGTKPDNTKVNARDKNGATLTPMDQGSSDAERKITAAVRKSVVGDKSLSFTAKNVKIITQGTRVTLRGPVKSDQEKSTIEAAAKQVSGVTDVDNQLEVKTK